MTRDVVPLWKLRFPRARGGRKSAAWNRSQRWTADRAHGLCEARCSDACAGRGMDAHHVQLRSQGGSDGPDNLLWLCRPCHEWIHRNPQVSYEKGWLRHGW